MSAEEIGTGAGKRAVLVSSPHSGRAGRLKHLRATLERLGIAVAAHLQVNDLDHAHPLGTHWREHGYDLAIAAGGDGTIGSVATHLNGSGIPLGILPMGTANDVARSLHLPLDIEEACAAIAGGIPVDVDVGQVVPGLTEPGAYSAAHHVATHPGELSPVAGVTFLHAVTLGLNVEFARLATDALRRERLGGLTYAASALEAVAHYRPVDVTLRLIGMEGAEEGTEGEAAENVIRSRVVQISIINMPVFGGALGVRVPGVGLRDRQLDFMVIEAGDAQQLRHVVQQLLDTIGGSANQTDSAATDEENGGVRLLPGVRRFRARAAILETDDAVDVTLDGEIRTHTPALVRVAPHRLRVLVPPRAKDLMMRGNELAEPGTAVD